MLEVILVTWLSLSTIEKWQECIQGKEENPQVKNH